MITTQRATKAAIKHASRAALKLRAGLGAKADRYCPACRNAVIGFFRYGDCAEWGCPKCNASPRERLVNHLVDSGVLTVPAGAILHMAPNEGSLVRRFSATATDYVPADLDPSRYAVPGMTKVDLMLLPGDGRFALFYASHVMEHVPDDAQVFENIFAALKPGGEAWLVVPLWNRLTIDGSFAMPPRERERLFGQWDHVRQYGLDFANRIRAAGFTVDLLRASDVQEPQRRHEALEDIVFRARRPVG